MKSIVTGVFYLSEFEVFEDISSVSTETLRRRICTKRKRRSTDIPILRRGKDGVASVASSASVSASASIATNLNRKKH